MPGISVNPEKVCYQRAINDEHDVEQAIKNARRKAFQTGFDQSGSLMICTIVAELCRNMLYHAGGGEFSLKNIVSNDRSGIEIEAIDHGAGITDIAMAMQDHFSTRGTLGIGLPAVKRLSDDMEIESSPEQGTTVRARKWL